MKVRYVFGGTSIARARRQVLSAWAGAIAVWTVRAEFSRGAHQVLLILTCAALLFHLRAAGRSFCLTPQHASDSVSQGILIGIHFHWFPLVARVLRWEYAGWQWNTAELAVERLATYLVFMIKGAVHSYRRPLNCRTILAETRLPPDVEAAMWAGGGGPAPAAALTVTAAAAGGRAFK